MSRDYPRTRYEIRTNHNSQKIYTLGSRKTLKEAREAIEWWRTVNTNLDTIWEISKAITIANGVVDRTLAKKYFKRR